jgi:uncharacterized protein YidB (DUF937 family)
MGFLDTIENMAGSQAAGAAGSNAQVAGGLMQALDEHPGGLAAILDRFRGNGLGDQVQGWASDQQSATPEQMQQGLAGTGIIERVAEKAGVSPEIAKVALATVFPLVISHFTAGGQQAAPQSGFAGMASEVMGKFL